MRDLEVRGPVGGDDIDADFGLLLTVQEMVEAGGTSFFVFSFNLTELIEGTKSTIWSRTYNVRVGTV